jgi:hypothetical protein
MNPEPHTLHREPPTPTFKHSGCCQQDEEDAEVIQNPAGLPKSATSNPVQEDDKDDEVDEARNELQAPNPLPRTPNPKHKISKHELETANSGQEDDEDDSKEEDESEP